MRTNKEILAKIEEFQNAALMFDFRIEVLVEALGFEAAMKAGLLKEDSDPWESWNGNTLETAAQEYLEFAYGKAADHRGISANRSVQKMEAFAWLLGRDDVVDAMDAAGYTSYGVPKLRVCAEMMGWPFPEDRDDLVRMSNGHPCIPGCEEGCE